MSESSAPSFSGVWSIGPLLPQTRESGSFLIAKEWGQDRPHLWLLFLSSAPEALSCWDCKKLRYE